MGYSFIGGSHPQMALSRQFRVGQYIPLAIALSLLITSSPADAQNSRNRRSRGASNRATERPAPEPRVTPTPVPLTPETLSDQIVQTLRGYPSVGLVVAPSSSGAPLINLSSSRPFVPASNRKIFTGALALDQLGSNFKYTTTLHRTGPISGGVVQGDIVITPSGDPTFNSELFPGQPTDWVFQNWASRVRSMGISRISGSLIVDASKWDMRDLTPKGWAARIQDDHYAPRTSPLSVNSNLITVRVNPGSPGGSPKVDFLPPAEGYPINMQARTGAGGGFRVSQSAGGRITVTGTGNGTVQARLPVDNPSLYAAAVFRHRLRDAGVSIDGGIRIVQRASEVTQATRDKILAAYQSPSMNEMVQHMMKKSDNHFAEQLYVTVAHVRSGRGSYSGAHSAEADFLRRIGMPRNGFRGEDGSGLSELNLVTAEGVTHLLRAMLSHPASRDFVDSMAVSGRDGTLRGRMRDTAAADQVRAKTGFINGVSCLSGYITLPTSSGNILVFSMLFNRLPGGAGSARATQDKICDMIVRAYQ